jgi:hypothetical protein
LDRKDRKLPKAFVLGLRNLGLRNSRSMILKRSTANAVTRSLANLHSVMSQAHEQNSTNNQNQTGQIVSHHNGHWQDAATAQIFLILSILPTKPVVPTTTGFVRLRDCTGRYRSSDKARIDISLDCEFAGQC